MIQVQLEPEIEALLAVEAQARGLELEQYVKEIVREGAVAQEARRKAVQAMLDFAPTYKLTLGGVDLKSMIHEGHKY